MWSISFPLLLTYKLFLPFLCFFIPFDTDFRTIKQSTMFKLLFYIYYDDSPFQGLPPSFSSLSLLSLLRPLLSHIIPCLAFSFPLLPTWNHHHDHDHHHPNHVTINSTVWGLSGRSLSLSLSLSLFPSCPFFLSFPLFTFSFVET